MIPSFEKINGQRIRCYDNGGKTADRYTVVYCDQPEKGHKVFGCRGMSMLPCHPQGVGMYSSAMCGRHLGKRIAFAKLPADCRALVYQDLSDFTIPTERPPMKR